MGHWPIGSVPSVRVFLRDPSRVIYASFGENHGKRLGRQARPGFEPGTPSLPVLNFITPSLVGLSLGEGLKKSALTIRPQRYISNRNNKKYINRCSNFVTTGKKVMNAFQKLENELYIYLQLKFVEMQELV